MFKSVLVLSPHTDDAELGCGGTIHKLNESGARVQVVAFSWCDNPKLKDEFDCSLSELETLHFEILDFKRRYFYSERQRVLDYLIKLKKRRYYDLVLIPSTYDTHQDHQVICNEAKRAFKDSTVLGYELPWNTTMFNANCFVVLSDENIQRKTDALLHYKSQSEREYFKKDFILGVARKRGVQIKEKYAEAFESIRWVIW